MDDDKPQMTEHTNHAPMTSRDLAARVAAYRASRWDLNAIWLLRQDVRDLLQRGLSSEPGPLMGLDSILSGCLSAAKLPTHEQAAQLSAFSAAAEASLQTTAPDPTPESALPIRATLKPSVVNRFETPPSGHWRAWTEDAEVRRPVAHPADEPEPEPPKSSPALKWPTKEPSPETNLSATNQRICHLSKNGDLAQEIQRQLAHRQIALSTISTVDDLVQLLEQQPTDLLLIDAEFIDERQRIGDLVSAFRRQHPKYLCAVQLLPVANTHIATDDEPLKVMDAVISGVADARSVLARINQILHFGNAEHYRVLIVEDDRSQALYAENILRNAEINTKTLLDSDGLISHIESFNPDLVLMDLNMPKASGIELAAMIRQSERFQSLPIVFLSGEPDEERQIDALEAGADDFLSKPIRPRRLIATVQNRIKRHLALSEETNKPIRDSGLIRRADMLTLIEQRINDANQALVFVEVEGESLLKSRYDLSARETLLRDVALFLSETCKPSPVAKFGDNSFVLVHHGDTGEQAMHAYAENLRKQVMAHHFEINKRSLIFKAHIGICAFAHGKGNIDILINAAERSARAAQSNTTGTLVYQPKPDSTIGREEAIIALLADATGKHLSQLYQPIVAVAGGTEKQFQSLLRLTDSNGSVITAAEFIPLAEKSNMIIAIDRWSMTRAVATIKERAALDDSIRLFVNQSNSTLLDHGQIEWMKNLLKNYTVAGSCLVIEINQDETMRNQQAIKQVCQDLNAIGVQFCLSRYDPATDESNLLESLPLSYVKLSGHLTTGLGHRDIRDQVKLLTESAHRHGAEVIGHCVEDVQSAATLWMSGIDFIQGNLVHSADSRLEFDFNHSVL